MQYGELWEYKRSGDKQNSFVSYFWLGKIVGEEKKGEKKRKKRKKKEKEKKTKTKVCFVFGYFGIPKVLVWRIVPPLSRVLWRNHPNP